MRNSLATLLVCIACSLMVGCDRFDRTAERNADTLFLGFSLGMPREEFYEYCWEQNRKKLFTHTTNMNVEYKLHELKHPVSMRFYPTFHEDKIFEMPVTFTYEGWAPWNREFWADTLLTDLLPVFRKWYGGDFKKLDHPTMGTVYYRIDGKRRINLFRKDDQFVQAVFTDLEIERKLKKAYAEKLKAESEGQQ